MMPEIEDMGLDEFYSEFVRIEGKRGAALLFYDGDGPSPETLALAAEIGAVLDAENAGEVK